MAVVKKVPPAKVGQSLLVALASDRDIVQGLWLTTDAEKVTFWVLTRPIATATQQALYEHAAALYDEFPDVEFEIRVLNPEWFENGDALRALPTNVQPICLRAA